MVYILLGTPSGKHRVVYTPRYTLREATMVGMYRMYLREATMVGMYRMYLREAYTRVYLREETMRRILPGYTLGRRRS